MMSEGLELETSDHEETRNFHSWWNKTLASVTLGHVPEMDIILHLPVPKKTYFHLFIPYSCEYRTLTESYFMFIKN